METVVSCMIIEGHFHRICGQMVKRKKKKKKELPEPTDLETKDYRSKDKLSSAQPHIFWTYHIRIYLNLSEMSLNSPHKHLLCLCPHSLKGRHISKRLSWNKSIRSCLRFQIIWVREMGLQERRSQSEVDRDGTLNFLLKHTGRLIAFERVGRASASPNASVNWVGKWRRLLSALGMEAREAESFAEQIISPPSLHFRPTLLTSRPPLVTITIFL